MRLSFFLSANDAHPDHLDLTWDEFCAGLVHETRQEKLAGPLFSPCEFTGPRRTGANAAQVWLGVLDLDHLDLDQATDVILTVQGLGLAGACYSSWKNEPGNVSLRLVVPFDRPVAASTWPTAWHRFNALLGGKGDPACKNVDRAYFLPSCPPERLEHSLVWTWPGTDLDTTALLAGAPPPAVVEAVLEAPGSTRVSRAELTGFAATLKRGKNPDLGAALSAVLKGEPWAENGYQDQTMFRICAELVQRWPDLDPTQIGDYFGPSGALVSSAEKEIEKASEKLRRLVRAYREKALEAERAERQEKALAVLEATGGTREEPYAQDELIQLAKDEGCTPEALKKRWILQRSGSFYFLVLGQGYRGPFTDKEARNAANSYLAPAPVALTEFTLTGGSSPRTIQDLSLDYGTVLDDVRLDLTAPRARYESKTRTLVEAPCPARAVEPAYHPRVDQWLRALGGVSYPDLERWIAWVTYLDVPCVALFLEGSPGAGKGMLAMGLARLWTTGEPTPLASAMGSFNNAIARCPLVLADETIPKDNRGQGRTGEIREFVQARTRTFNRKFLPETTLNGAVRLIIAANNRKILSGEANLSAYDVEAIAGRFLHVHVDRTPSLYLASQDTEGEGWVSRDLIAGHALYLRAQVPLPARAPRFLIQPRTSELAKSMSVGTSYGSAVSHWLVQWLLNPKKATMGRPLGDSAHLVLVRAGKLYAGSRALSENWTTYETNMPRDRATIRNIAEALNGISEGVPDNVEVPGFPVRQKLRAVRPGDLVAWANETGYATEDQILTALASAEQTVAEAVQKGTN